jgi:hypothetical protein
MIKDKESYGEDPANALFKELFAKSDENTRRAMMKSY